MTGHVTEHCPAPSLLRWTGITVPPAWLRRAAERAHVLAADAVERLDGSSPPEGERAYALWMRLLSEAMTCVYWGDTVESREVATRATWGAIADVWDEETPF